MIRWKRRITPPSVEGVTIALVATVALVGVLQVVFLVLAVDSAPVKAEEVARRVAPEVTQQVIADARSQRIANARGVLGAANEVLADRGLPMVADPGPQANAEQVLAAASSAQVLSVLPEDIVLKLRDQLDGRPIVLPSAEATAPGDLDPGAGTPPPGSAAPAQPGPTGGQQPAAPGNPGGTGGAGPGAPGGDADPGGGDTDPLPPTRRRLIPQIVPLPIPLIGT